MAAASCSRAVNSGRNGSPDWTHTVFGARNVADPPPLARRLAALRALDTRRSPLTATSSWRSDPSRCSARASSAAVSPRAPHRAIRSALATLAGEKTVFGGVLGQHLVQVRAERGVGRHGRARLGQRR